MPMRVKVLTLVQVLKNLPLGMQEDWAETMSMILILEEPLETRIKIRIKIWEVILHSISKIKIKHRHNPNPNQNQLRQAVAT